MRRLLAALTLLPLASLSVQASEEVNVYSYRQPFLIQPMFDLFTQESGIEVNTVFAKEGLIERLSNEGVNSPADLLLTADFSRLYAAVQADVTQPVTNETLEQRIPAEFREPEGLWFGLTNRARLLVTAKDRVEAGSVTSYEDLADPALAGKVCSRSGKHPYMVALIASMIAHHGEEDARTWLEGVKANQARKPQGNDRAQVKAIAEGECDIAIINSYYMGAMQDDPEQAAWANAVDIVFPNQTGDNNRGTHMNISGVAMTQAAPNRDNALRLMEFLVSDTAQTLYAEENHEYPVVQSVPASELVQSWGEFAHDTIALSDIAEYRAAATRMVDEVGYDG